MTANLHIIGGGLAGSEAAWQAAEAGAHVLLHEMRPHRATFAHQTDSLAELVCSNSFRSDDAANNAVGLLHEEMRRAGSLVMRAADMHKLPAGGALAVDRHGFSAAVTAALQSHPRVRISREEVTALPSAEWGMTIIATGPLTSEVLGASIRDTTGADQLAFFDAIAPIVHRDSIDFDIAWFQSRYDKEGPAAALPITSTCRWTRPSIRASWPQLLEGEKTDFREWEKTTPYFEACLPIEVMAARGEQTLSFGPMKPVGLVDPRTRRQGPCRGAAAPDNRLGTLWNMVGFQTKLKHAEQVRIFRTIPGLEKAEFARLGGLHRNTFINSPRLLDGELRLKSQPHLRFAGQVTGVEGYVESAAIGLLAGRFRIRGDIGARRHANRRPPLLSAPALSYHRGAYHRRRRCADLPADECQFRAVPGISQKRQNPGKRSQTGDVAPGTGRPGGLAWR